MYPIIAIVGRPNVGKSTIFNKLVGKRHAIVSDIAGTTRDRVCKIATVDEYQVMFVDTGGVELESEGDIENDVQQQAKIAIEEADMVLFVVDAKNELTAEDYNVIEILRKAKKKCILIANKCDNISIQENSVNLFRLGFNDPCYVSAVHGIGFDELKSRVIKFLLKEGWKLEKPTEEKKELTIALIGKPNVGKSSLANTLCGKKNIITSATSGTTRDAIEEIIEYNDRKIVLIDTPGIRKRGKIGPELEKFSVLRSFQSISRADVAALVIDWAEGISKQDQHLSGYILKEFKGLIVVVNKIDLMEDSEAQRDHFISYMQKKFAHMAWVSVVFTSAHTKKHTRKIFDVALEIEQERKKRIPTRKLNLFLKKVAMKHHPTTPGKKFKTPPKMYYLTQTGIEPPQFVCMVNDPEKFHFSYYRFMEKQIRKEYGFQGTAIELIFRKKSKRDDEAMESQNQS